MTLVLSQLMLHALRMSPEIESVCVLVTRYLAQRKSTHRSRKTSLPTTPL